MSSIRIFVSTNLFFIRSYFVKNFTCWKARVLNKEAFGPKLPRVSDYFPTKLMRGCHWEAQLKTSPKVRWKMHIFYKQSHFRVEPRIAMKFHKISCYEVAKYFQNRGSRLLNFWPFLVSNVRKTSKIRQNFRFEAQKLLRISNLRLESC